MLALIRDYISNVLPAPTVKEITNRVNARMTRNWGEGTFNPVTESEIEQALNFWREPEIAEQLKMRLNYVRGKVTDNRYFLILTEPGEQPWFDPDRMEDHDEGHLTALRRIITYSERMADMAAGSSSAMTDPFMQNMWEMVSDSYLAQANQNKRLLRGMELWMASRRNGTDGPTGSGGPPRRPPPSPLGGSVTPFRR